MPVLIRTETMCQMTERQRLMKNLVYISCILLLGAGAISGQTPEWFNFTNGDQITTIAQELDTLWVGTTCGLVKIDRISGDTLSIYHRANSELPDIEIRDIVVGINGEKWIGTRRGLVKLEGSNWTVYDTEDGLPASEINTVVLDTDGLPIVGTPSNGLGFYDDINDHFTITNTASQSLLPSDNISDLAFDINNGLWIATDQGLVSKVFNNWIPSTGLPSDNLTAVTFDLNGVPWVGTQNSGAARQVSVNVWDSYDTNINPDFPANDIRSIACDNQNKICVGTETGGLGYYYQDLVPPFWETYSWPGSGIPSNAVHAIYNDNLRNTWVGTTQGLARYSDNIGWSTGYITSNSGLPHQSVQHLAPETQTGGLWISTGDVVTLYDGTEWTTYEGGNAPTAPIRSIWVDNNETLFAGTEGAGVYLFSNSTWENYTSLNYDIPGNYIVTGVMDASQTVWVSTESGLSRFDGTDWTAYTTNTHPDLETDQNPIIAADHTQNLWLFSETAGIRQFNYSTQEVTPAPGGMPATFVTDMIVDYQNNLWTGTDQGLWVLKTTTGEWKAVDTDLPIIRALAVSPLGNVWVGTSQGLVKIAPKDTDDYTVENSRLIDNSINDLTFDINGNLWAGTERGLALYTIEEIGSQLVLSDSSLDFGQVVVGDSATRTIQLTNIGNEELLIDNAVVINTQAGVLYESSSDAPSPFEQGAHGSVSVKFKPLLAGTYQAMVVVISNSPTSPDTVHMQGSAEVLTEDLPIMTVNPDPLTFGRVKMNTTKTITILLMNIGNQELQIAAPYIDPPQSAFSIASGPAPTRIDPGDTSLMSIAFKPTELLPDTANLILETNTITGRDTVRITGRGTVYQIDTNMLPSTLSSDSSFSITLVPDEFIFGNLFLYYKSPGQTDWLSRQFSRNLLENYTVDLESTEIPPEGLAYYITRVNLVTQEETVISGGPDATANWLTVESPSVLSDKVMISGTYGMVTIPYHLTDRNIGRVFSDELGSYDPRLWRIYYWWNDSEADTAYYREYNPLEAVWNSEPGKGFWVITYDTVRFDIDHAFSVDSRTPYQIMLKAGWNQIGNPFTFPVAWNSVSIRGATVYEPVASYVVEDQETYSYNQSILNPWEGYFVYADGPAELQIPPVIAGSVPKSGQIRSYQSDEWVVQLRATGLNSGVVDRYNYVGMLQDASDCRDPNDWLEPPAIRNAMQLNIIDNQMRFAANYKKISANGACWELEVKSSAGGELAEICLDYQKNKPDHFHTWLLDMDRGAPIPIQNNSALIQAPRQLKLILGTQEYADTQREDVPLMPQRFELRQNYPNPFNPSTTIAFQLAERSRVKLEIYNILGKRVRTWIHQNLPAGSHEQSWDGRDTSGQRCASGLYFYRLSTPIFTATQKMIRLQ